MDKQTQQNLLDLVKKSYDDIAENFDITRQKHLWPEIIKLADMVKDGDRVFDVGCGNGRLINALKDKKINYLGIDNNKKLIELAKSKFSILNFKFSNNLQLLNFQFQCSDILNLNSITEDKFDYIFCIAVLHQIPGEDLRIKALEQLKNKLTTNGKIILTVWNLWSQKKFRNLIIKYYLHKITGKNKMDFGDIIFNWKNNQGKILSQRYYHAFTIRGLKKIIKKSHLNLEKIYKDRYNYYAILSR